MTTLEYKIPGKTFLLGEYGVLQGGTALVANTAPCFKLIIELMKEEGECHGIHPQSPAGRLVRDHQHFFSRINLKFLDPYVGKGGMGASTAQFLGIYSFIKFFAEKAIFKSEDLFVQEMLVDYVQRAWSGLGFKPSGADLISQFTGGLSVVTPQDGLRKSFAWPFEDKTFVVVRTGKKVTTHTHLENLSANSFTNLKTISERSISAVELGNWNMFVKEVNDYRKELQNLNLTWQGSIELLEKINTWPEIEGCKACGAAGADTILLLLDQSQRNKVEERLAEESLEVVARSKDLTHGIQFMGSARQNIPQKEITW